MLTSIPSLPLELLPTIFESIASDPSTKHRKRDFIACSSVSPVWREFAIPHLFGKLVLSFFPENTQQEEADNGLPVVRPTYLTLSIFRDFLRSSPHIRCRIHTLTLSSRELSEDSDSETEDTGWNEPHVVDPRNLLAVFHQLPQLRDLTLRKIELIPDLFTSTEDHSSSQSLILERLCIEPQRVLEGGWNPMAEVFNHLSLFDVVGVLHLRDLDTHIPIPQPVTTRALPTIHSLILEDVSILSIVADIIRSTPMVESLRSLEIGCIFTEALPAVGALLDDVRANLTDFSCSFQSERRLVFGIPSTIDPDDPRFEALDLACCPQLQSLKFLFSLLDCIQGSPDPRNRIEWTCAARMLRPFLSLQGLKAPPRRISVAFHIDCTLVIQGPIAEPMMTLIRTVIKEVESLLIRLVDSGTVKEVILILHRWGSNIPIAEYGIEVFPRLYERGVLNA